MNNAQPNSTWTIFLIFLKLGLTSFGGPIAHIAYFREEFVERRAWLSDSSYADVVALCQFLPGPASSQVGLAIGLFQDSYQGALAAWLGFTLPSALALVLFAFSLNTFGDQLHPQVLQGLKIVAVAVVTQAVWGMARSLCPDISRISIMTLAACLVLIQAHTLSQTAAIIMGGFIGLMIFKPQIKQASDKLQITISRTVAIVCLALFFILLLTLPLLSQASDSPQLALLAVFYRAGALVFGGGHVILPLLQTDLVGAGWINNETFLAGYGATQAVPGPLFTFAAFLGTSINGWSSALIALLAIFLPGALLIFAILPFWKSLRRLQNMQAALMGINAAVVGLLLAALYNPIWTTTIQHADDMALALIAFVALQFWKIPPWLVVLLSTLGTWLLALILLHFTP